MLIDTHCHLTHELFEPDLSEVIQRAKDAGFIALFCSGINRPTNEQVLSLAKKYPIIKPSLGLYPIDLIGLAPDEIGLSHQTNINLEEELEFIKKHKDQVHAIGEVGLDYHWSKQESEHIAQKKNFQKIIEFVEKIKKPIVVHTRKAEPDCIEMLESSTIKHILLHCFEGRKHIVKKAIDLGYNFSVPTTIVKSQHFQMVVELSPLTQLFTETDSPWLTPIAGKRNEPSHIIESIKKMAEIKKVTPQDIERQIYKNYKWVFEAQWTC